jgi:hypothetical protein
MQAVPVHVQTDLAPQHSCWTIFSHGRVQTFDALIHMQFGSLKQSTELSYFAPQVGLHVLDAESQTQSAVDVHVEAVSVWQALRQLLVVLFQ